MIRTLAISTPYGAESEAYFFMISSDETMHELNISVIKSKQQNNLNSESSALPN